MAALGAPAPPSGRGVDALLLSRKRRRVLSLLPTVDGGAPDIVAPAVEGAIPPEIIELYEIRTHIHGATPAEVAAMLRPVVDIILYVVLFYARCREMREHASWRRQGIRLLEANLQYCLHVLTHSGHPDSQLATQVEQLGGIARIKACDAANGVKTALLLAALLALEETGSNAYLRAKQIAQQLSVRYPGSIDVFDAGHPMTAHAVVCRNGDLDAEFALALFDLGCEHADQPATPIRLLRAACSIGLGFLPPHPLIASKGMFAPWVPTQAQKTHLRKAQRAAARFLAAEQPAVAAGE